MVWVMHQITFSKYGMRVGGGVGESSSESLISDSSADVQMRRKVLSGLLKASGFVFGSVRMSSLL
jgi:hypothetical protein